jgi:hypothetical protein
VAHLDPTVTADTLPAKLTTSPRVLLSKHVERFLPLVLLDKTPGGEISTRQRGICQALESGLALSFGTGRSRCWLRRRQQSFSLRILVCEEMDLR